MAAAAAHRGEGPGAQASSDRSGRSRVLEHRLEHRVHRVEHGAAPLLDEHQRAGPTFHEHQRGPVSHVESGMLSPPRGAGGRHRQEHAVLGLSCSCAPVFQPCGIRLRWLIIAPWGTTSPRGVEQREHVVREPSSRSAAGHRPRRRPAAGDRVAAGVRVPPRRRGTWRRCGAPCCELARDGGGQSGITSCSVSK